jgi:hypothetical protein
LLGAQARNVDFQVKNAEPIALSNALNPCPLVLDHRGADGS